MSNEEINEMIADAEVNSTLNGSNPTTPHVQGKVTFEEFEVMVSTQCKAKSAENWRTILEKNPLTKGAKSALKKYNDLNIKKNLNSVTNETITAIPLTFDTCVNVRKQNNNKTSPNSILEYEFEEYNNNNSTLHSSLQITTNCSQSQTQSRVQNKINFSMTSHEMNQKRLWLQTQSPTFHSSTNEPPASLFTTLKQLTTCDSLSDRELAVRNVKWSLSGLTAIALFRMVVLKI